MTARAALAASLCEVLSLLAAPGRVAYGAMAVAALRADALRAETPVDSPRWGELLDLGLRLRRDDLPTAPDVAGWLDALQGAPARAAA